MTEETTDNKKLGHLGLLLDSIGVPASCGYEPRVAAAKALGAAGLVLVNVFDNGVSVSLTGHGHAVATLLRSALDKGINPDDYMDLGVFDAWYHD